MIAVIFPLIQAGSHCSFLCNLLYNFSCNLSCYISCNFSCNVLCNFTCNFSCDFSCNFSSNFSCKFLFKFSYNFSKNFSCNFTLLLATSHYFMNIKIRIKHARIFILRVKTFSNLKYYIKYNVTCMISNSFT